MRKKLIRPILLLAASTLLVSCSYIPGTGPSEREVTDPKANANTGITIIKVTKTLAQKLTPFSSHPLFSRVFPPAITNSKLIEVGDVIEVRLWEAPPAVLFGGGVVGLETGAVTSGTITLPEQMIGKSGEVNIPFVGAVSVAGRSPQEVENEIMSRLSGKAHKPQALVRLVKNTTADVTVVGEVTSSTRMPLTAKDEKLLDALAAAGGTKHPVDQTSLQLTRGSKVYSMPLEMIVKDQRQNITMQAGDIVTALHQTNSFTVLGATGKNAEIDFETKGITLAQALARAGGLVDTRANPKGVFVFRFEPKHILQRIRPTKGGYREATVPVIYQVNLGHAEGFFAAQKMPIKNNDLIYIAESPSVELSKFINLIFTGIHPTLNVINAAK